LALGAFLAGLVISESDLSYQAAADALPLRDAFAVLFFVSVGMLFDWHILLEQPWLLATLLLIILLVKPLITFIIVALYRYPTRFGLLIAASRAQIGEFSFILGALGLSLAVFDDDANSLLLAAAILSISLNPLAYGAITPVERWLRSTHWTRALTEGREVSVLEQLGNPEPLRGHAIVCGHGRVGAVICRALERRSFEYVVVEQNRRIVDQLRARGVRVVYGDAANPLIMEQLGLDRARVLIVAMPEPITARIVVERAAELSPRVPVVVRTHSEREREWFEQHSIGEAVVGEVELALEMTRYALRRFGVRSIEIQAIVQGLRTTSGSQSRDEDWE
jgi:CPA2 family monovalent cation:H+ antiporter-2